MPRLPKIGDDEDNWGYLLNQYLSQAHRPDGTLKIDVQTVAALKALDINSVADGAQAILAGYNVPGDHGGGSFYYDATADDPDDGGSVVAPSSGDGRWKRGSAASDGAAKPEQFGARGDGADDTEALVRLAAFVNAAKQPLPVSINGTYRTFKTIQFTKPNLVISGSGKIIKGGRISIESTSETDTANASSIITLAGEGQKLIGLTVSDEDHIDGPENGYGRAAIAVAASHCLIFGVTLTDCVQGIQVAWSTEGFVQGRGNWKGREIVGTSICDNKILRSRPHHEKQAAIGSGIRSFGSDNTITGNYIVAADEHGPDLRLLHGIKIEGLAKRHPDGSHLNDRGGVISGNTVIGPYRHSIYTEAVDGVTINGNVVRQSGREAISFQGANTIVTDNFIEVGGYFDGNPACGIRSLNGKNYVISNNIIRPWRNEGGSTKEYTGILIGANNGHGKISNNLITRNASVISKYTIKNPEGKIEKGSKFVTAVDGVDRFRMVTGLAKHTLTVTQGSGWFDAGTRVTQPSSGWSATIAAWDDPADVGLDTAIDAGGAEIFIDNNRIERGVSRIGIKCQRASNVRIHGNLIQGYARTGVAIRKFSGDLVIEGNEFVDALSATGSAVDMASFRGTPGLVSIRHNRFLRNAIALKIGDLRLDNGGRVVLADNDFFENEADVVNPERAKLVYMNNTGLVTSKRGQATMPSGHTSVSILHGLMGAPAHVLLTPRGNVGPVWVSSVDNQAFTCHCGSAPSADTVFDWSAEIAHSDA